MPVTLVFQILALVAIILAAVLALRGGGARHQAVRRILLFVFIVAAASSVFFPQAWTWAANLLGIGRGTDLLLYITVLTFLAFIATTYRKFRQVDRDMTQIARRVALLDSSPREAGDSEQPDAGRH